jgi:hypothetical protein
MATLATVKAISDLDALFPRVPPPFDAHPALYSTGYDTEYDYVNAFFDRKGWWEVNLDSLNSGYPGDISACWHFMTPEAFAYYLPGFLDVCKDWEYADIVLLALCNTLATPRRRGSVAALQAYLNTAQREAIGRVLEALIHEMDLGSYTEAELLAGVNELWRSSRRSGEAGDRLW